nr:hypothetical protein [Pandoravirus belohorizontensis]
MSRTFLARKHEGEQTKKKRGNAWYVVPTGSPFLARPPVSAFCRWRPGAAGCAVVHAFVSTLFFCKPFLFPFSCDVDHVCFERDNSVPVTRSTRRDQLVRLGARRAIAPSG